MSDAVNSMSAAWCAKRRADAHRWLESAPQGEGKTLVIELLNQLERPPAGVAAALAAAEAAVAELRRDQMKQFEASISLKNFVTEQGNELNDWRARAQQAEGRVAEIEAQAAAFKPNPFFPADDWGDENGCVLWWTFPICEPPYVGSPLDLDWDYDNTFTHWQKIDERGYDNERAQRDAEKAAAPVAGSSAGQQEGGQGNG